MAQEKRILKSTLEPENSNWLWLEEKKGKSTLKEFVNGLWKPVSADTADTSDDDQETPDTPDTPTPSDEYVTWDDLIKELNKKQGLLSPGAGIEIKDGIITCTATFNDIEVTIKADSQNPVASTAIYNALLGKQDVLTPGTGISILNNVIKADTDVAPTVNSNKLVTSDGVYTALAGKQSTISDLSSIRSGAGKGASSVQSISVNNGTPQTPDTNGVVNITISSSSSAPLTMGSGSLSDADDYKSEHQGDDFQWLLIEPYNNTTITKLIWWVDSQERYIDALGATIS